MNLTKDDLKQIRNIVKDEVVESKNEIISTLSEEITNLAEINRAVIRWVDKIDELEKRIIRLEERAGIKA